MTSRDWNGRSDHKDGPCDSAEPISTFEGVVVDVLDVFGLAHIRTSDGATYGINRETPGVEFSSIRIGQKFRIVATARFNRIVRCELVKPTMG